MQTVLFIKSSNLSAGRRKASGFMAYAENRSWNVQLIDPVASRGELAELLEFWKPDGVAVNCGGNTNAFPSSAFRCPVIYLDRPETKLHAGDSLVYHDSRSTAALAARELLSLGLSSYGFIGWPERIIWDGEREAGFCAVLKRNGLSPKVLLHPTDEKILKFCRELARPAGIFVSTDIIAAKVISAAVMAGIRIPEDLAVIGVDNDLDVCEYARPTLSSVAPDWFGAGRLTAEALDRLMKDPKSGPIRLTYPPVNIIRRQSTQRLKRPDPEVSAALERIRREACGGLTAGAVVRMFTCSRRMAEIRFRQLTDHSILDAIRSIRLERAKELLAENDRDIGAIANFCGYGSMASFSNFFKSMTGVSPNHWRRKPLR